VTKVDTRGFPPGGTKRLFILLEANQFGETATFRLSLCSSIMKILFTSTTVLDREFGPFGSHKNHILSRDAKLGWALLNAILTADGGLHIIE
jgi:hypothetical protein